jgi:muramoyltetrapeptide carboxypeptidase LdcA involved in peptidoglycan recycling
MIKLKKLKKGDKVAVLSPSFAAPGKFPHVYELGLKRIREIFELIPVEYPTTRKLGASTEERTKDIISAFSDPEIKAVIASIGGDDQVTYVKDLPSDIFINNPKPFFGYSDNSHLCNFLFLNKIPSYYGACLMTQFAMQNEMDQYTKNYINKALFEQGEFEITEAPIFNEIGIDWGDETLLSVKRQYDKNEGWFWDGNNDSKGLLWGGCVESIDDMLRNNTPIPALEEFTNIVLMLETSEEMPSTNYVHRVLRALGQRGIIQKVKAVLVGRAKSWEFGGDTNLEKRSEYKKQQRDIVIDTIRKYNENIPVIQNMDFGHTDPQVPMPYGGEVRIDSVNKKIFVSF